MNHPSSKTVLAFMAHPDDAEILCAGTLARLHEEHGWNVAIATATAGDAGSATLRPDEISRIRYEEARRSVSLLDGQYYCVGCSDLYICYDRPTLQKFVEIIRRVRPDLVITHSPEDYMVDHEMTSLLARAASFLFAAPNASRLPLPADVSVPYLYYCDPIEGVDPLGNPVLPTTYVDVSAQLEMKTRMLACHASQREWLLKHHGVDEYIDSMRRHMSHRGKQVGVAAAEAFVQHRGHAYPQDDLLARLFPLSKMV